MLVALPVRGVGFCIVLVSLYTDLVLADRFPAPRFPNSPLDVSETRLGSGGSPLVGSNGLEPSTSRLSGVRSNHLSYEPISVAGSNSSQTCLLRLCAFLRRDFHTHLSMCLKRVLAAAACRWWRRTESNCRPPACKAGALPAELRPRLVGRC